MMNSLHASYSAPAIFEDDNACLHEQSANMMPAVDIDYDVDDYNTDDQKQKEIEDVLLICNPHRYYPSSKKLISKSESEFLKATYMRDCNADNQFSFSSPQENVYSRLHVCETGMGTYRRMRRRAVLKNGDCNVFQVNISERRRRYLQDIFTTLVDAQWRWTLAAFVMSFLLSWLSFASIWWLISFSHGDFLAENINNTNWIPCIYNIKSFTSCFLFSVETQHSTGFGSRFPTEECAEAIVMVCIQSIIGVMIQAFMVGIVFAKMARPKQRTQTLLFSKNCVICQRDGQFCLQFRIGDMREKSHLINAVVRVYLVKPRITQEGEKLVPYFFDLPVEVDDYTSNIFMIWPTTVTHKITAESPLYNTSATDLLGERFEIIAILEGTTESTGQTTQARTSYIPSEILWGHRFEPLVTFNKDRFAYAVDYAVFHNTYQVDTPLCSAAELDKFIINRNNNVKNE